MANFLDATWLDMVPTGWQKKFKETCDEIAAILDEYKIPQESFNFIDVKEKWGELRVFYHIECPDGLSDESWKEVIWKIDIGFEALRVETQTLCVECGDTATMVSEGYTLPFCECCAIAYNRAANARHKTDVSLEKAFRKI